MSQPRPISPGATYLLTRRTMLRHMLLRPDAAITQLILYALAISANRFGIHVHALCAMSTHLHLVVTDVGGKLPRFLHEFHRLVALGTKVLRAWNGPVWDQAQTSVVKLVTQEAVEEKIAYTLANPVAAGLVRYSHEWPGAKVRVSELGGGVLRAKRPTVYFDPNNPKWLDEATLKLRLPPGITEESADGFRRRIAAELERQEAQARAETLRQGRRFLGTERVCKVSPHERATSYEPLYDRNPTFAVGRGNGDAWRRAVDAARAFRAAYSQALDQWRAGVRSVVFPVGTWWMRVFHGVNVGEDVALAA